MNIHNLRQNRWGLFLAGLLIILIVVTAALVLPGSIKQEKSSWHSIIFLFNLMLMLTLAVPCSLLLSMYFFDAKGKDTRKKFGYYIIGISTGLLLLLLCYGWLTNDRVNDMIYDFLLGTIAISGAGLIIGHLFSYWPKPDPKI